MKRRTQDSSAGNVKKEASKRKQRGEEERDARDLPLSVRLKKLFFSTLYLSTFTFGGGYVIVSLLKKKFVDELHWIDDEEMMDLVAIAQSSPGAIAVNGAIVVGFKLAGVLGILVSVLGAVLPPFVILTVISYFYTVFKNNFAVQAVLNGMKAGVSAVIMDVVWDMASGIIKGRDPFLLGIMAASFVANYCFNVNVAWIILITAGIGAVVTIVRERSASAMPARGEDLKGKPEKDGKNGGQDKEGRA